jgi:hypothetical protein
MTRILAIMVIGLMLVVLASLYAGSARASRVVLRPSPHVVVRLPTVRPQQQLSFWGVGTSLQQYRDEFQPLAPQEPRKRSRLHKMNSANRKQWPGFNQ